MVALAGQLQAKVDEVIEDVGMISRVTIGGDPGIAGQGAGRVAILPRPRRPARQAPANDHAMLTTTLPGHCLSTQTGLAPALGQPAA